MADSFDTFLRTSGKRYAQLTRINDRLFVGGYADANDASSLRELGVTAIMNLTTLELPEEVPGEFKRCLLHCADGEPVPARVWQRFFDVMNAWTAAGEIILVHCGGGLSRGPSFTIAWLMLQEPDYGDIDVRSLWSVIEDRLRATRPQIAPHAAIKRSFFDYLGYEYAWPA